MDAAPWTRGPDTAQRLTGKRALVTGAGTRGDLRFLGVGEAIAVLFAVHGATVAVGATNPDSAAATLRLIEGVGGSGVPAIADLTDDTKAKDCINTAAEQMGGLDIVVNSAAISPSTSARPEEADLDDWARVMSVNLTASVLTVRAAVPHMLAAGGGSIINISSIVATRGHGSGAYTASKAALLGLSRDWAFLYGRSGIRSNAMILGHALTPMAQVGSGQLRDQRRRSALLNVQGEAWDVAWPAVFFASDESRWVTAAELVVDGGTTATTSFGAWLVNARDQRDAEPLD